MDDDDGDGDVMEDGGRSLVMKLGWGLVVSVVARDGPQVG